mmetsp:Transcript_38294/g.81770  ORF Transcript_38294/g.81770 Transcript_38294/m.81770 type:complete len:138 (-) Transcript_38294:346-759(-)|eukprot:CAMPEP_0172562884 /NCGR_PEP_ID=MMETSP1067-20121228/98849_1 /TAXON_ID=265564 ORGANISM="Thalassiosira punctigera, Strain Tpunct2005C2" /NCGR_SAMPLE_ID=MMETSP1067 /ASSEMBLY_ACC=CAM_ASM_000444 /LENGTH=137 /DNA_ID=CAMNT_0013353203 /DNA_START=445 /DNA_END=858 /DNA_ORIENTATION=-
MTTYPPRSPSVRFSEFSELAIFSDIANPESYSSGDIDRFKWESIRIGQSMAGLLANTPPEAIPQEYLYECVGNELLLKRGLTKEASARKRAHVRAIVLGQHLMNKKDLSNLSTVSSHWARTRAEKTAIAYSTFLKSE